MRVKSPSRTERASSAGAAVLLIYGAVVSIEALLADTETEWWLKAAIVAVAAGVTEVRAEKNGTTWTFSCRTSSVNDTRKFYF